MNLHKQQDPQLYEDIDNKNDTSSMFRYSKRESSLYDHSQMLKSSKQRNLSEDKDFNGNAMVKLPKLKLITSDSEKSYSNQIYLKQHQTSHLNSNLEETKESNTIDVYESNKHDFSINFGKINILEPSQEVTMDSLQYF